MDPVIFRKCCRFYWTRKNLRQKKKQLKLDERAGVLFVVTISDKTLHKISRKIGAKRVALGMELELDYCDVETLQCQHSDPVDHAFQILLVRATAVGIYVL